MKKSLISAAIASTLLLLSGAVLAQNGQAPAAPGAMARIEKRQAHEDARIQSGAAAGTLTQHETNKLERGQARVDNAQAKAMADGTVTRKESKRIGKKQDREGKLISKKNHDMDKP